MRDRDHVSSLPLTAILKGLVMCFICLIVASLILGFIFSASDALREETMNRILMVVNYIAIVIGGVYAAHLAQVKGWLMGGLVGIVYMLIVVFIGSRYVNVAFGLEIILRVTSGFLTGAVGGVFGVNIK